MSNTQTEITTIIEIVSYRLKADKTQADLAAANAGVNQFVQQQPGFIYRSCSSDDTGLIFDIIYWQNMELAQAAVEAFRQDAAGHALFALADKETVTMRHMLADTEAMADSSAGEH